MAKKKAGKSQPPAAKAEPAPAAVPEQDPEYAEIQECSSGEDVPMARLMHRVMDEEELNNTTTVTMGPIFLTILAALYAAWMCVPNPANFM